MNSPLRLSRKQVRTFSAHHMLLGAAHRAVEAAKASEVLRKNNCLVAITFAALSIEAMANVIGDRVLQDWKDLESASPTAKIRVIAEHLKISFERSNEPWATVLWLAQFRNRIAHPKPEQITVESKVTQEELDQSLWEYPPSRLEREITLGNAKRAVSGAYKLKEVLCEPMSHEQRFGVIEEMWSDNASAE